jgi:DNA-binding CsgD family transcriptional regulator
VNSFEQEGVRYVVLCEEGVDTRSLLVLTQREREIVAHAASGSTNKEIAQQLGISDATVRVLMSRAANRLGVRRRKELLAHPALRDLVSRVNS